MKSLQLGIFVCCAAVLAATTVATAQPAITSASGTFSNGQSVTISGSSFGAKATAAPFFWDNFESGTSGTNVSGRTPVVGTTNWSETLAGGSDHPVISNSVVRSGSGKSVFHNFTTNYNCSSTFWKSLPNTGDTFYTTFWYRIHKTTPRWTRNFKVWFPFGSGSLGFPIITICWPNDPYSGSTGGYGVCAEDSPNITASHGATCGLDMRSIQDEWVRAEVYGVQSSPNVSDGTYQTWAHRPYAASPSIILETSKVGNEATRYGSNYLDQWNFGSYFAHDGPNGETLPSPVGAYVYTDDVYFDTTQARVEIGNASTWATCTHREIQIPSAWSASSITATVNLGSFPSGTAYLYVVDSTGAVSNGQPVTLSASNLPVVTITATTPTASETGPTNGQFTVTRTGSTGSSLTVNYTVLGLATNGTDYSTLSGSVTIASGSATAAINVVPVDDAVIEGEETVTLAIAGSANYIVGITDMATVTIVDNDAPNVASGVLVDWGSMSDGSGNSYGPNGWTTWSLPNGNTVYSAQGPYGLKAGWTGSFDDMCISGTPLRFNAGDKIVVTWYNTSASAVTSFTPEVSLDCLTYYGNHGDGYWFPVDAAVTVPANGTQTTTYTVTTAIGSAGTHTAVGVCRFKDGADVLLCDKIEIQSATVLPTVTISATTPTAKESGPTNGQFTVTRNGSTTSALVVNYSIDVSSTATNGVDYSTLSGTVTINSGSTTATITVTPLNDSLIEGNETVILNISANPSNYTIGSPSTATVTIADNDYLLVDFGSSAAGNVYGTSWQTVTLGNYRVYSSAGPYGINGGTTNIFGWQCISGATAYTFTAGQQVVVTWYNGCASAITFTPQVSFTRNGDESTGTWYPMSTVTSLQPGTSTTSTYTIDSNSAGSHTLVNACHNISNSSGLMCDKIQLLSPTGGGNSPMILTGGGGAGAMTAQQPASLLAAPAAQPATILPPPRKLVPWTNSDTPAAPKK